MKISSAAVVGFRLAERNDRKKVSQRQSNPRPTNTRHDVKPVP